MKNEPAQHNPKYPTLPSRYFVEGILGHGAAGIVLRATEPQIQRTVAIKVLADTKSSTSEERFHREALLLSKLEHAHIVRIFASGISDEGSYYHVMEYLEGETLSQKLKSNPSISKDIFFDLFQQMFSALEYAHSMGIVHRDIKPSNIMLSNNPIPLVEGKCFAKLVDFGIGKEIVETGSDETGGLTKTGALLGTPLYMSPEQCRGAKATAQSDIYSMGCIMYECLSGTPPFKGISAMETMRCHLHDLPAPLTVRKSETDLAALVMRCLEKDPEKRPSAASAREELVRIEQYLHGKLSKRSLMNYAPHALAIIITVFLLTGISWQISSRKERKPRIENTAKMHQQKQRNEFDTDVSMAKARLEAAKLPGKRKEIADYYANRWSSRADNAKDLKEKGIMINEALALCQQKENDIDPKIASAVYLKKGEYLSWSPETIEEAFEYYHEALAIAKKLKQFRSIEANALAARIRLDFRTGRFVEFKKDVSACLAIYRECGMSQKAQELVKVLATQDLPYVAPLTASARKKEQYLLELLPALLEIDSFLVEESDVRSKLALDDTKAALKLFPGPSNSRIEFSKQYLRLEQRRVTN